jgi:hypothetical protein
MVPPRLKRRDGAAVDYALIKAFQNDFRGQVIQPGDASYDTARRIWNASIDKHPGLIARCLGAADIVHAVKFARANDLLVAVRSGGHNVTGRALCDDGIVIDLSAMKGIFVDLQPQPECSAYALTPRPVFAVPAVLPVPFSLKALWN